VSRDRADNEGRSGSPIALPAAHHQTKDLTRQAASTMALDVEQADRGVQPSDVLDCRESLLQRCRFAATEKKGRRPKNSFAAHWNSTPVRIGPASAAPDQMNSRILEIHSWALRTGFSRIDLWLSMNDYDSFLDLLESQFERGKPAQWGTGAASAPLGR